MREIHVRRWCLAGSDLALVLLSSVLLFLAFPKSGQGFLAWVALVPLFLAIKGKPVAVVAAMCHGTGIIFFTGLFYWIWTIPKFNALDYVLLGIVYLPLYVTGWGVVTAWVGQQTRLPLFTVGPIFWVIAEYLRGHAGFLSFPWMLLGHSQYANTNVIQISAVTGVYGVSFAIVVVNALLADTVADIACRRMTWRYASASMLAKAGTSVAVVIALHVYGLVTLHDLSPSPTTVRVAVVQGNIALDQRWDAVSRQAIVHKYRDLTLRAAEDEPDLIVWPETAVPGDVERDVRLRAVVESIAREVHAWLLVGTAQYAKFTVQNMTEERRYNSNVLFAPDGTLTGRYRKILLVPFGEYLPLKGLIRWPKAIVGHSGSVTPGDDYMLFELRQQRFGTVICWENIFAEHVAEFVRRGAEFMVITANEAWFGETAAPHHLLAMTVFRAVENHVAVVRAANTGISAIVDPSGTIVTRVSRDDGRDVFIDGFVSATVPVSRGLTFYTTYGEVFAGLQFIVGVGLIVTAWIYPLWCRAVRFRPGY